MKKGKLTALCAMILIFSLLSGCWSSVEINEHAFVMGIAVDAGGAKDELEITVQVAKPAAMNSRAQNGEKEYANFSSTGTGIDVPLHNLELQVDQQLYAGHNQAIVISREVAEQGISSILDFFIRSSDGRFTVPLFIAEESAKDILDVKGELESMPALYIKSLVQSQTGYHAMAEATVRTFLSDMLSKTSAAIIPMIKIIDEDTENPKVELSGAAVFKNGLMCMELDTQQARALLLIQNQAQGGIFTVEAFDNYVTLSISDSTTDINPVFNDGALDKIIVDIHMGCSVTDTAANVDILSEDIRNEIKNAAEKYITGFQIKTFEYTQEYSADIYGFGQKLYRYYPKQAESLLNNWDEEYPKLNVEFRVNIDIQGTGAIINPLVPGDGFPE